MKTSQRKPRPRGLTSESFQVFREDHSPQNHINSCTEGPSTSQLPARGHQCLTAKPDKGVVRGELWVDVSPQPRRRNPEPNISKSTPEIHRKRVTRHDQVGFHRNTKASAQRETNVLNTRTPKGDDHTGTPTDAEKAFIKFIS